MVSHKVHETIIIEKIMDHNSSKEITIIVAKSIFCVRYPITLKEFSIFLLCNNF